jgi:type II secretory pathway component PulL
MSGNIIPLPPAWISKKALPPAIEKTDGDHCLGLYARWLAVKRDERTVAAAGSELPFGPASQANDDLCGAIDRAAYAIEEEVAATRAETVEAILAKLRMAVFCSDAMLTDYDALPSEIKLALSALTDAERILSPQSGTGAG